MATLAITQAELTSKEFDQLTKWAAARGYAYNGQAERMGLACFVFGNRTNSTVALVPASSDTADEAINALIASILTYQMVAEPVESATETAPPANIEAEVVIAQNINPDAGHTSGVPPAVLARIRAKAQQHWPDDYSMQRYQIKEETEAYLDIN